MGSQNLSSLFHAMAIVSDMSGGGGTWRVRDLSANDMFHIFKCINSVCSCNSDWFDNMSDTFTTILSHQFHERIPKINYLSLTAICRK